MSAKLEHILDDLKVKYGTPTIGKKHGTEYHAIPKTERKNIIRHLIQTLKDQGKDKEFLSTNEFRLIVAEWCFPDALTGTWEKRKRVNAYGSAITELRSVVAELFPEQSSVAVAPIKVDNEYDPSKHKSFGKELDRSVFADAPKPNTTVDEEMSKLLGFDDE